MAWTAPRTWVATNVLTAAQLNTDVRDNMLWLGTRKGFRLRRVAVQSIPNTGVATAISFDTEDADTDGFGAVPATSYTVPSGLDGLYSITALVSMASTALGTASGLRMTAAGVSFDGAFAPGTGIGTVTATIPLAATNTVAVSAFQNGAGAVNATAWLYCHFVGR